MDMKLGSSAACLEGRRPLCDICLHAEHLRITGRENCFETDRRRSVRGLSRTEHLEIFIFTNYESCYSV